MFRISVEELKRRAYRIRRDLIELHYRAGSGHLDTSLSLVEVWLALVYSDFFQFNPQDGAWEGRDRIFLSEGHACPLQYLVNADLGYGTREEVFTGFRRPFTPYQGHTARNLKYALENSNGSLGIGLWHAYGSALEVPGRVFCIVGDGEMEEPSSFGLLAAPHFLKPAPNFTMLINYNHLAQDAQVDLGPVDQVARLYEWEVQVVDGHSFNALGQAYRRAVDDRQHPHLIICQTVKGKGGNRAWEGKLGYHGRPPKDEAEYKAYLEGLEATYPDLAGGKGAQV